MKKTFLLSVVGVAIFCSVALAEDALVQCTPDPQAVFSALGIRTWQIDLPLPQDHASGLAIYRKAEQEQPSVICGIDVLNSRAEFLQEKVSVMIVIQSIFRPGGERKLLVGMRTLNGSDQVFPAGNTIEIDSPFLPNASYRFASPKLTMDAKGRVLLAFSSGTNTLRLGRNIEDYSSAIYLELAPLESK